MTRRLQSPSQALAKLPVARTIGALRKATSSWRNSRASIALVPTMGALHDGHLALVRLAKRKARRVVVSIFVNPTQFAPNEDFGSYPRTFDADRKALSGIGVDLIWAPSPREMYPEGFSTRIEPEGPAKAGLEDAFRPHFFGGVATVVTKLLTQVGPDVAIFGEKDYQQLKVITAVARDLDLPVTILGAPTVREKDGLALSSRNAYLSADERAVAPVLNRVLKETAASLKDGRSIAEALAAGRTKIEAAGFAVDYLEARHAHTLAPIAALREGPARLLVAAKLGRTRLIDNIKV